MYRSSASRAAPDIVSLFADFAEVRETGWASFADHWHVLPTVLLPYGLLLVLHLWLPRRLRLPQSRWALLIIVLVLAAKPWRATYRDYSSFLPGPTRSGLHNSFNAFAFYSVRLAFRPAETLPKAPFVPYQVTPVISGAKHVWVVVADSLRTDRLGLADPPRRAVTRTLARRPPLLRTRIRLPTPCDTARINQYESVLFHSDSRICTRVKRALSRRERHARGIGIGEFQREVQHR